METIVSHLKQVNTKTMTTRIMTIQEVMETVKGDPDEIRYSLQQYGSLMVSDHIYHVLDRPSELRETLNQSITFEMRDGQTHLIKVLGIGFMGTISGIDEQGMETWISLHQVNRYYVQRGGQG